MTRSDFLAYLIPILFIVAMLLAIAISQALRKPKSCHTVPSVFRLDLTQCKHRTQAFHRLLGVSGTQENLKNLKSRVALFDKFFTSHKLEFEDVLRQEGFITPLTPPGEYGTLFTPGVPEETWFWKSVFLSPSATSETIHSAFTKFLVLRSNPGRKLLPIHLASASNDMNKQNSKFAPICDTQDLSALLDILSPEELYLALVKPHMLHFILDTHQSGAVPKQEGMDIRIEVGPTLK